MFKIHYVGNYRVPFVEFDPEENGPERLAFFAWCYGKGIKVTGYLAMLAGNDEHDFRNFALDFQLKEIDSSTPWPNHSNERVVPIESDLLRPVTVLGFVSKNPNCTFTQIKNSTGLKPGVLGKALDGFVEEGKIKREKKGSQFFYST